MTAAESTGAWLDRRLNYVDRDLAGRIRAAVPEHVRGVSSTEGARALAIVASAALRDLISDGCETRASAPALLIIDALVTYACELAAEADADAAESASFMLREIASVMGDNNAAA